MSDLAIKVEKLSKQYKIGLAKQHYDTLGDVLTSAIYAPFRVVASMFNGRLPPQSAERLAPSARQPSPDGYIWALKDVSFEVKVGEVIGFIGRNGAGKSTLLKILSHITHPTSGRAEIHGRVSSLLEVGIGFQPELTGRENIYLNGAILGMKKAEIERKFDEIVAFAEIEKFIDTPVKRYSSGMYVRLAFAVAAHLEPEILIVDEVLAVGDVAFQKKCLGKIGDVVKEGRTVLFVSHNMPSVQHLCNSAILLESGRISLSGQPSDVIALYLSDAKGGTSVSLRDWRDRITSGEGRIVRFEIADANGEATNSIPVGGSVRFSIHAEFYEPIVDPCFCVLVHNAAGEPILDIRSTHGGLRLGKVNGSVVVEASIENLGLYPGHYVLSALITDSTGVLHALDWVNRCCKLQVHPAPGPHGDLKLDPQAGKYWVASNWAPR